MAEATVEEKLRKDQDHVAKLKRQADAAFSNHELFALNAINKSNRNLTKRSDIYAEDEEDRSLKYYKLGKSA